MKPVATDTQKPKIPAPQREKIKPKQPWQHREQLLDSLLVFMAELKPFWDVCFQMGVAFIVVRVRKVDTVNSAVKINDRSCIIQKHELETLSKLSPDAYREFEIKLIQNLRTLVREIELQ